MKKQTSSADSISSGEVESFHPSSFILHPSKRRFGQNFLVDRGIVDRLIDAVRPQAEETIIEIGPGRGALTSRLVEKAGRVIAIEFGRDLVPRLRAQFAGAANLELIEADALDADFCEITQPAQTARVVARLTEAAASDAHVLRVPFEPQGADVVAL